MADAAVAEEIRKRRAADALLANDDEDPDPELPLENVPGSDENTGSTEDVGEKPPSAAEEEIDQEEAPTAAEEKAPRLGYKFVPVSPPAQDVPQNVPRGTFLGEEGADVSPALTSSPVYSTPIEEGNQQYVIDRATGAKIPRAQLATSEDLAAQPPPSGAQMQRVSVEGPVPRATLVDPDPDEQYFSNPNLANKVKRAQLVDPDPDSLYLPPGTEDHPDAQRAALIGRAIKRAALVDPDPDAQYLAAASELEQPPKVPVTRAPGVGPTAQQRPAQILTARALPAGAAQPVQKPLPAQAGYPNLADAAEANVGRLSTKTMPGTAGGSLGCAGGVCKIVRDEMGYAIPQTLSTAELYDELKDSGWKEVDPSTPGAVIVSPTRGGQHGHTGIVGYDGKIYSNSSATGDWEQNYTVDRWTRYFGGKGLETHAFLPSQAATGQVAQVPGAAPQAQPVTKQANGLYQNEKPQDFLSGRATTFATPEDIASGQDNGVGTKNLGHLDTTNAAGVAIPEAALRAKYGNNYAAWRRARVDVVDPQTGKRLRVPIVDLGPRGDQEAIADMTPTLSSYFGGDKNLMFKLVDNAGPDVVKNPQLFADEQAAIRQGFDSSAVQPGVQKIVPKLGYTFKPVVPSAEGAARQQADVFNQQNFRATIAQLPEADSGNIIGLYKRLDKPVETVPDSMRQEVKANLKPQIIAAMREKFPELKTDDEAWAKAQSDVNALDVGREWVTKALGYAQQFTNVMQKGVAGSDQLHVNQYLDAALPGASDADKHAYLTKLYAMPVDQRIQEVTSHLPQPQAGMPSTDPQQIVSALDRLSDPNFQKQQAADLAKAQAEMKRNVTSDPRLVGTGMEKVVDATAQMPAFVAAFFNPVMMPVALAQVSDQVKENFRAQHPEWSEKELQDKSAYATLVQFYGMEAANRILMSGGGAVLAGIQGRGQRAIAQAIYGTAGQAAIGAGTQAATNIIGGQPIGQGVGEAALAGGIQGLVGGIVHGAREPGTRPEGIKPAPKDEAVQPPLVTPEKPQLTTRPLSAIDVLGDEPPQTITPEQTDDVLKVVAHNVFPDLNDYEAKQVADRMAALTARNLETDRLRYELQRFLPQGVPYSFGSTTRLMQAYGAFQRGPTVYTALELQRAQDAFNAVRNPQVRVPGALKLPIMWREVEAQIPEEGIQPHEVPKPPPIGEELNKPRSLNEIVPNAPKGFTITKTIDDPSRQAWEIRTPLTKQLVGHVDYTKEVRAPLVTTVQPGPPPEASGLTMVVRDAEGNIIGQATAQKGRSTGRVTVGEMLDSGGDSAALAQEALDAGWSRDDPMPKRGEDRKFPTKPGPTHEVWRPTTTTGLAFYDPRLRGIGIGEQIILNKLLPELKTIGSTGLTEEGGTSAAAQAMWKRLETRGARIEDLPNTDPMLGEKRGWVIRQPAVPVTREDVARRTYELNTERTKNGQPGTALDDYAQAQKELSQASEPPPVTQGESEPWVSAIANRFTAERAARGELGEVVPGKGLSTEDLLARGLQMGPEEINQHVSDLVNNRGGNTVLQGAAIRAEEARLSQRSNAASRAYEANPSNDQLRANADNAFKDLTDFHNGPVAKFKKDWSDQGRTLQGELPVDLSTFNGMREAFLKDVGKPPPDSLEPTLRSSAKKIHDAAEAEKVAMQKLSNEIERQTAGKQLSSAEAVRNSIRERMGIGPCST